MNATRFISYVRIMMTPNKTIRSLFLSMLALMLLISGCGDKQDSPTPGDRLSIVVSVQPLSFVVRQVGGEAVDCEVMVPPGRSPATYEPTPRQMGALSEAIAFVTVGVPYERVLLKKIREMYPSLRLVDLSSTVVDSSLLEAPSTLTDHGDHQHGDTDPHVWMDPRNVKLQAKVIAELLTDLDSSRADLYAGNLTQLESALDSLHEYITERLRPVAGAKLYVFHPAYGWMARAYGLHQIPVEVLGKEPGSRQVTEFVRQAREDGIRAVFVQPQMASPAISAIASEVGAQVVTLDPLSGDYLKNMRRIADSLAVWLGPGE